MRQCQSSDRRIGAAEQCSASAPVPLRHPSFTKFAHRARRVRPRFPNGAELEPLAGSPQSRGCGPLWGHEIVGVDRCSAAAAEAWVWDEVALRQASRTRPGNIEVEANLRGKYFGRTFFSSFSFIIIVGSTRLGLGWILEGWPRPLAGSRRPIHHDIPGGRPAEAFTPARCVRYCRSTAMRGRCIAGINSHPLLWPH